VYGRRGTREEGKMMAGDDEERGEGGNNGSIKCTHQSENMLLLG
jgi:hypothetical protein